MLPQGTLKLLHPVLQQAEPSSTRLPWCHSTRRHTACLQLPQAMSFVGATHTQRSMLWPALLCSQQTSQPSKVQSLAKYVGVYIVNQSCTTCVLRVPRSGHAWTVQVAQHSLAAGDEMTAVLAFDTFTEVIECRAPILGPVLPQLLQCSLEVALNKQLELNTREQALQVCLQLGANAIWGNFIL